MWLLLSILLAFQVRLGGGLFRFGDVGAADWGWTEYQWVAWGTVWMKRRTLQDGICPVVDEETVDVMGRKWFAAEGWSVSRFFGWEKWWAKKFV